MIKTKNIQFMKTRFLILAITVVVAVGTLSFTLSNSGDDLNRPVYTEDQAPAGGLGEEEIL